MSQQLTWISLLCAMLHGTFVLFEAGGPFHYAVPERLDGSYELAYCRYNPVTNEARLHVINSDGTGDRPLGSYALGLNHHEWSPDGAKLACIGYVTMQTTWSVFTVNADGSNLTRLTAADGVFDGAVAWSPDGSKILFTRNPYNGDDLWLMNADGSNQHALGVKGFQPSWSPDGTRIAYAANKTGNYEIYTSAADGSNEKRLTTNSATDLSPAWSPDGTRIAFASDRDENFEVYVMDADGSRLQRLTSNPGYDGLPKWSPDGTCLAYNSTLEGTQHTEVFIMNADGSHARRLTSTPDGIMGINPSWRPAAASTNTTGHLISLPDRCILHPTYPNPFNPSTTIRYDIQHAAHVDLEVFDIRGIRVRVLADGMRPAGWYATAWNGRDDSGARVPSGLYFIRLSDGRSSCTEKALVLR